MRLNPIQAYRDFRKKKAIKQWLVQAIRGQPPGTGVPIVTEGDEAPVWAAAVMELVPGERPDLMVVRTKNSLTLCKRSEIEGGLTPELKGAMKTVGAFPAQGEKLHDDL